MTQTKMNHIDTMKLALALNAWTHFGECRITDGPIPTPAEVDAALRQAIEQAEQAQPGVCERCMELERLCDATYVASGADAYNHACSEMERWQHKRVDEGKEAGCEGSLCDGIEWLYGYIEELESKQVTAPPRQPWVGLTDEEVMDSWEEIRDGDWAPDFYAVIEAQLKEKNNGI